jgi:pimeloyl-ACP methyl ester carboxylesterase
VRKVTNNFVEEKVIVNGKFDLVATVAIPEDRNIKMPAVVLIPGTGTLDRDGNMPKFPTNLYKGLSDFFAGEGFVTIRYDKRGNGESKGDHNETGFNDLVDDVISNVKYLENLDFVDKDKIILCGHSEGTMIATITSTRHKLAGMILIAGAGTTLRAALNYQNSMVLQETKTMTGLKGLFLRRLINEKNYLKRVDGLFNKCCSTDKEVIRIMGQKIAAKWIREHNNLTEQGLLEVIANASCPVLAVTGEKDVQANPEDIRKIAELELPHVTCDIVPDMDHMLRRFTGNKCVLNIKKQYISEFSEPIHEELLKVIREWAIKTDLN